MTTVPGITFIRFGRSGLDHTSVEPGETLCGLVIPPGALHVNRVHNSCPGCESRDPRYPELIQRVIDLLYQTSSFQQLPWQPQVQRPITAWDFDGAEPWLEPEKMEELIGSHVPEDVDPPQVWPFDVRTLVKSWENEEDARSGRKADFVLSRFRSMHPRELRGRVRPLPFPIEILSANPRTAVVRRTLVGRVGRGVWVPMSFDTPTKTDLEYFGPRTQTMLGLASLRHAQWRVYLGLDDRPGIELPTTPQGAAEVFRLRDIPEGKQRRAALRHWVNEFWRPLPGTEEETKVREHMRGVQSFAWSGLRVRITPSRDDLQRDEQSKINRAAEHREGTDRRRRGGQH